MADERQPLLGSGDPQRYGDAPEEHYDATPRESDVEDEEEDENLLTTTAFGVTVSLPELLRSASRRTGTTEPTVLCGICLENVAVSTTTRLRGNGGPCSHRFCKACLAGYLGSRVRDGHVSTSCPHYQTDACRATASEEDHRRLLSPGDFAKYERFRRMAEDENWRDCPKCGAQVLGSPAAPEMRCHACGYGAGLGEFCFFHANQHAGMSCAEHHRRVTLQERSSEALVSKLARPCPRCGAPTIKSGGCNHMTCQRCRANWCWLCNRDMDLLGRADDHTDDPVGWHYNEENPNGCANKQFIPDVPLRFLHLFECWDAVIRGVFGLIIFGAAFAVSMTLFSILALFLSYYVMILLWIACRVGYAYSSAPYRRCLRCLSIPLVLCVALISVASMVAIYGAITVAWAACALPTFPLTYAYFRCRREWTEMEVWALIIWPVTYVSLLTGVDLGINLGAWLYDAVGADNDGDGPNPNPNEDLNLNIGLENVEANPNLNPDPNPNPDDNAAPLLPRAPEALRMRDIEV
uniref:RBR-type E3 ubiquitin transferase n=1 Tax=Phaeomonas parva TaxID=124430 RepID=A0A6U4EC27_9STRA|mmetsp:Transcript_20348/g.61797  ORF Transcript_20348/g.61797 Transcript_20348/m.61797 type:complete len:522 (+) Transcript_20348:127-1692(+)